MHNKSNITYWLFEKMLKQGATVSIVERTRETEITSTKRSAVFPEMPVVVYDPDKHPVPEIYDKGWLESFLIFNNHRCDNE